MLEISWKCLWISIQIVMSLKAYIVSSAETWGRSCYSEQQLLASLASSKMTRLLVVHWALWWQNSAAIAVAPGRQSHKWYSHKHPLTPGLSSSAVWPTSTPCSRESSKKGKKQWAQGRIKQEWSKLNLSWYQADRRVTLVLDNTAASVNHQGPWDY